MWFIVRTGLKTSFQELCPCLPYKERQYSDIVILKFNTCHHSNTVSIPSSLSPFLFPSLPLTHTPSLPLPPSPAQVTPYVNTDQFTTLTTPSTMSFTDSSNTSCCVEERSKMQLNSNLRSLCLRPSSVPHLRTG